ncbi:hypothetical protein FGO68_gene5306 [Halteria grandinella]|uniref:Uncharacterized protein n=1 Tax=Halteria grandinella TaxID=5974 RepID=A0A8J8N9H4_HALGN|nr:hypothetical protein FGO68_gene5306 [Halteria grandinella]
MPSQRRQELINEVNSKQRSANDLPPVQLLNQNRTRQQDINNALANAQSYHGSYESGPNQGEAYQGEENEIQRHYDDIMHKMEQQKLQQQQFNGQQYQRPAGKIAQQVQRNNSKDNNSIQSPSGREANKSSLIGYGQQTILSPHGSSNSPILLQGTNLKGSMPSKRALDEQKFLMHYQKPMADKTVEQGSYLIAKT